MVRWEHKSRLKPGGPSGGVLKLNTERFLFPKNNVLSLKQVIYLVEMLAPSMCVQNAWGSLWTCTKRHLFFEYEKGFIFSIFFPKSRISSDTSKTCLCLECIFRTHAHTVPSLHLINLDGTGTCGWETLSRSCPAHSRLCTSTPSSPHPHANSSLQLSHPKVSPGIANRHWMQNPRGLSTLAPDQCRSKAAFRSKLSLCSQGSWRPRKLGPVSPAAGRGQSPAHHVDFCPWLHLLYHHLHGSSPASSPFLSQK